MELLEAIRTKRAVRNFTGQPVPESIIHQILHAGRRAQSSKNSQPWHFIVVRQPETLKQLSTCGRYAGHLAGAAFAVAIISSEQWAFDIGQAAAYLQLAAWSLGVSSCLASLSEPEKAKAILGVPPDKQFHIVLSFGYAAGPPSRPKATGRRPLEDVVRWEHW
ncbi:MAG: nitroreductase family protein [Chloroflexi bacterium]|nr:nitroreductase family protein [Chloroflexota bacterium]MCI0576749.1 nitroreductase family protein [Chloroflexota bacterium]MCI0645989.1 nitroreductase family protein [Chloroflexota bacterium]MCI0726862.1 nitroreductase family protein [Chloroflexota bacterium]